MDQRTGIAAGLSIVAAIGSFIVTCMGHPIIAFIMALAAIPLGIIGLLMAASPKVSGGMMSIVAIVLGVLGIGFAVLGMLGVALF